MDRRKPAMELLQSQSRRHLILHALPAEMAHSLWVMILHPMLPKQSTVPRFPL